MKLLSLHLIGFRNLSVAELAFHPTLNIFCGPNGQGKTNLLEAINLTATLKTFKTGIKNSDLIQWGQPRAQLNAKYDESGPLPINIVLTPEGKKATLSGKKVKDAAELGQNLAAVTFTPDDLQLIKGSPDNRRRALDRFCFGLAPRYAQVYRRYAKTLAHRNQLLKSYPLDRLSLEAFNETLIQTGIELIQLRSQAVEKWARVFQQQLAALVAHAFSARMKYQSQIYEHQDINALSNQEKHQIFDKKIKEKSEEEIRRKTSMVGPHLDDIFFEFDGRPARKLVSQGQARAMVLALKIAEVEVIHHTRSHPPLLLLDDVISELDQEKAANLLKRMTQLETQTFITTTEISNLFSKHEGLSFRLFDGHIQNQNPINSHFEAL